MLTYTFSKREKALILVLAIVLIALVWYELIFVGTARQKQELQSQIETAQTGIDIASARTTQIASMRAAIEEYKAAGAKKVDLPAFDNTTPLMARLNTILASTEDFSLAFDAVDASESVVQRGVTISFTCRNMKQARKTMEQLERDSFACAIDSASMSDDVSTDSGKTTASVHVIYFESNN